MEGGGPLIIKRDPKESVKKRSLAHMHAKRNGREIW